MWRNPESARIFQKVQSFPPAVWFVFFFLFLCRWGSTFALTFQSTLYYISAIDLSCSIHPPFSMSRKGLKQKWVFFQLVVIQLHFYVSTAAKLKQLHVITRHGSRPHLNKDPNTMKEEGGETLTVVGQKQLYDLGEWLRQTYRNTIFSDEDFLRYYDFTKDRFESSNLDRTLTSANSLGMGLFPLPARMGDAYTDYVSVLPHNPGIPVYTRQDVNDVYLRAYHNCPKFHSNVEKLYESTQWKTLEENNKSLLVKLAEKLPDMGNYTDFVPLSDVWNYYDQIHVARTECNSDPGSYGCETMANPEVRSALTQEEFVDLEKLTFRAEQMKYGPETAQDLLGSNLFWKMMDRVEQRQGRFFLYSAHAPTILGLFSTLKEGTEDEQFIDYGSALIMEVYQEAYEEYSIRFVYKAASKEVGRYITLTDVNCITATTIDGSCAFEDVVAWADENTLASEEEWCKACVNTLSDVCLRAFQNDDLEVFEEQTGITEEGLLAGVFFGGFFSGLLLMLLCCSGCKRSTSHASKRDNTVIENVDSLDLGTLNDGVYDDEKSFNSIT